MSEVSLIGMSLIKAEARLVGFFFIKKKIVHTLHKNSSMGSWILLDPVKEKEIHWKKKKKKKKKSRQ